MSQLGDFCMNLEGRKEVGHSAPTHSHRRRKAGHDSFVEIRVPNELLRGGGEGNAFKMNEKPPAHYFLSLKRGIREIKNA